MIIVLKQDAPDAQVREFCHELQDMVLQINDSKGSDTHIQMGRRDRSSRSAVPEW